MKLVYGNNLYSPQDCKSCGADSSSDFKFSSGTTFPELEIIGSYTGSGIVFGKPSYNIRDYINTFVFNAQFGGGGGIDPFGVALGVGELAYQGSVYSSFGRTAESVDNLLKNGKYLHNGEVYYKGNYPKVTSAMKNSLSAAKFARNVGRGFAVIGAASSIYEFAGSNKTGSDYARLTGAAIITGSAFIPVAGPFISIGLGLLDSSGAFDGVYNYFGK